MACLFGHKWNGCTCSKCGKQRDEAHKWAAMDGRWHEKCAVCGKTRKPEFDPADGYRFNGRCMDEKSVGFMLDALDYAAAAQPMTADHCSALKALLKRDKPMLKKGDLMLALACLIAYSKSPDSGLSEEDRRYISVIPVTEMTPMLIKPVPTSQMYADDVQPAAIARFYD